MDAPHEGVGQGFVVKAGIRLQYGAGFTVYSAKDGVLLKTQPSFVMENHYENEINDFVRCIRTKKPNAASIDKAVITSRIMQAIYESSDLHREMVVV